MPDQYAFITRWRFKAPLKEVWDAIYKTSEWPQWWKGVKAVKLIEKGDADDIGEVRAYTWRSALPYTLTFNMRMTHKEPMHLLRGEAFGELEGVGLWQFEEKDGITRVQYNWDVKTIKPWMNNFSFILKPAFQYNHDVVMNWGAEGLSKKLNAELLKF
ncbi:MAG: SRPBCC family protein [Chitinophagaceae bacterium]|nr:SRPBCC family protein [Chitinophagaceae bacterium]